MRLLASIALLVAFLPAVADDPKPVARGPLVVDAKLVDDSSLRVTLLDERVELATKYGTLTIPTADVRRIELALRLTDAERKKLDAAVADLGHNDFRKRTAASADCLALREKALAALTVAAKSPDAEAARRANEVVEKIRAATPAEALDRPPEDVVWTEDARFVGTIAAAAFKVQTRAFGDQPLKLADLRSVRVPGDAEPVADALPDPGTFGNVPNFNALPVGFTGVYTVTGAAAGQRFGSLYGGPEVYSTDSQLALAVVHAGLAKPGQTVQVRLTNLGMQPQYASSTRNGITSTAFAGYPGVRVEAVRKHGGRWRE